LVITEKLKLSLQKEQLHEGLQRIELGTSRKEEGIYRWEGAHNKTLHHLKSYHKQLKRSIGIHARM
jgi:hypothetical protein